MIGVVADPSERTVVSEFFELFKVPWEFYRSGRRYEVLLRTGEAIADEEGAKLVLVYGGRAISSEDRLSRELAGRMLVYQDIQLPVYGNVATFVGKTTGFLLEMESKETVAYVEESFGGRRSIRIGYDLFGEIRALLTSGQPACNAGIPALDLHISLLRDLIIASGVPLIEIPAVPEGYRFIACLTHDVDHPSIVLHRLDHTVFGFLYRAVVCSVLNVLRRRMTLRQLGRNWVAAFQLPFTYIGFARDFWRSFDRYPKLEGKGRSTFFVIPFKGRPGRMGGGLAPRHRASAYGAADITADIQTLKTAGCEIGLHGIDAWVDGLRAREELDEIRRITGAQQIGVRMHWLYFDSQSPAILERAGADYDSTAGYNGTIGYRAGTTQVYKPLGVSRLLELPLHIMDTALFYPTHLDLPPWEASKRVQRIIDNAVRHGGSVTINWHDRSIAPERGWGEFYVDVVNELAKKGAWTATAGETVAWFRKRRSAAFRSTGDLNMRVDVEVGDGDNSPALLVRTYNAAAIQVELVQGTRIKPERAAPQAIHVGAVN